MAPTGFRRNVVAGLLLLAAITAAPAGAQTTFTNRTAWAAAVGAHATINFEGLAPAGGSQAFPGGLSLSGVTFNGADNSIFPAKVLVVDSAFASFISAWSSGAMLEALGLGTETGGVANSQPGSISLPSGVTAVGFNYATTCIVVVAGCVEQAWTVRLSTGQLLTIPGSNPPPAMGFWGVVSTVPISSIQVNPGATFLLLDNFSYAPLVNVPALSTWAFFVLTLLLALAGVAALRRRATDGVV
jgi:hypothetical protein